jgi:hypothetical protein
MIIAFIITVLSAYVGIDIILHLCKKNKPSREQDTKPYEEDNKIQYTGFLRKRGDDHAFEAVLEIYDNGLIIARVKNNHTVFHIVDMNNPKGKYYCDNGWYEFFPSEDIE